MSMDVVATHSPGSSGVTPHLPVMSAGESRRVDARDTGRVLDRVWTYSTFGIGGLLLGFLIDRGVGTAVGGALAAVVCALDARRRSSHS